MRSVGGHVFRPALRSLHQSRSVLGLFLLLVEGFGLDDGTDLLSNARILDAWHDEHDLINVSLGAIGRQFICVSLKSIVCASLTIV